MQRRDIGWIAVGSIESHGLRDQRNHRGVLQRRFLDELQRCHLVFATRPQTRLDAAQTLAAPKTEEDALVFCANQKDWPIREVHQMTPLDGFLQRRGTDNS